MSITDQFRGLLLVLLCGLGFGLFAAELPDEPRAGGALLLPGRLPWGPTALPTGEILAPCEDQSVSVLDERAQVISTWTAPARFSGPVTVGPRSSLQLVAAPMVTGRVEILVWDPVSRVLGQAFSAVHDAEAVATTWGPSGTVYLAWKDGWVEAWTPKGTRLWGSQAGFEAVRILADEGWGILVVGPGHGTVLDIRGRKIEEYNLPERPRGVLETLSGDIYCWTGSGLWKLPNGGPSFQHMDRSPVLLGVTVDRQDRLLLTEPDRLRRIAGDGTALQTIPLPRPAVGPSVLDDRGRIYVGTDSGLECWTYDGRFLGALDPSPPVSTPLLTDRGLGAWSSADWKVHVWAGFHWIPFGWPQDGGDPGRSSSARRPASVAARSVGWAENSDFSYFYQLVSTGEEAKQRQVLDQFEAKYRQGTLQADWPFANLILLKIARSGLTDLLMNHTRVVNNWPGLRLRAYALLAETAGPEDRDELVTLLGKEFDPSVVAQGTQALARSGWDGDGKLMRLLAEVQARMPDQSVVADAVVDAARELWLANGRSTDPVLVPLVSAVFQGPFPRSVKRKAQKFFQDLLEAP